MNSRKQIDQHRECGQSLLETSFMLIVIFMVVFLIIEMCGMMYTFTTIANAAEEGVRYGITRSPLVTNDVVTRVKNFTAISMHDVSHISVQVTLPDGGPAPPNRIRVTVSYTYVPWLNNVINTPLVMSAYSEGTMVVQ